MSLSSSVVDVQGRPTEIRTGGEGEPLVLLHGGGILEGFDPFDALGEHFRVIAPLMPGYGATELDPPVAGRDAVAQNVIDVLDALEIPRAVLVGHSLGGWRSVYVTARFADRVSELILAAPFGMDVPGHPLPNLMAMGPAERLGALTKKQEIWVGRLPTGPDPAFEAARAREGESLSRFMPGPHDPEVAAVASTIRTPTLLLWGEDDGVIPFGHATTWQETIPEASLQTFPDTGHLLFHERPEAVQAIVEFVDARRASPA